jgi:hypothetical protein
VNYPVPFDPFATPFAVVPNQAECRLPDAEAAKWMFVPPLQSPGKSDPERFAAPRRSDGEKTGFCVYKWRNQDSLPKSGDFDRIGAAPDGAVIGTREHLPSKIPNLPPSVSRPLLNTFEKLARDLEAPEWQALAKRRIDHPGKAVKVAVIDATPKALDAVQRRDFSLHGLSVTQVIGSLLCSDVNSPDCSRRVRPYLALPMITSTKEDAENGGLFGTFFHLYDALARALGDWRPSDENLVINLSLGWDPIKADQSDPRVGRIRGLLERASCMGALIVASTGNPTGTDGPIWPAAFEEFRAPDAAQCGKLGVKRATAPEASGPDAYVPLVHAVGAVDSEDQRLIESRRWSQPRIAGYGQAVMVPGTRDFPYTPPETGPSIATAIVSGIAAAVWAVRPKLDAAGVMDLVYRGGLELDGGEKSKRARTEFCVGEHFGPCDGLNAKVHRAYLCGALKLALASADPKEELECKPPFSTDVPVWPQVEPSGGKSQVQTEIRDCRVPDCGIPHGQTPNQVAGVTSHGYANCPGCTLNIATNLQGVGMGTLGGTPSSPSSFPTGTTDIKLVLHVTGRGTEKYLEYYPAPTFDAPMSVPAQELPDNTSGASLRWYYYVGAGSWIADPDDPPGGVGLKITR